MRSRIERILDAAKALDHRHGGNPAQWKGHLEFILTKRRNTAIRHHAALPFGAMSDFMPKLQRQDGIAAQVLGGVDKFEPVSGGSDLDHSKEAAGELIVAGRDGAVDLEMAEHALDAVALLMERPVMLDLHATV